MDKNIKFSIWVSILVYAVIFWSVLSLMKLGARGDGDPILTPLRMINTDIIALSVAVLYIINHLGKKDN